MLKKFYTLLLFSFILSSATYAARQPIKFGKVSLNELKQTNCPIDSSASAMIICNYGYFQGSDFSFTEIRRIKIFTKDGTSYGDIITRGGEDYNVRGFTFNLVNGKIEKTKLKRESIFKEKVTDDLYRYRIAMPNVKVGSVIDIQIDYSGMPSIWYFQKEIPVLHSELQIIPSSYIDFRKNMYGFESLEKSTDNHFIAKNMPAFKSEAFMTSRENYISKIEFDILRVSYPGYYKSFTTDWEALRKTLMDHEYFGQILRRGKNYLNEVVSSIEQELGASASQLEKTKAAYQAIKKVKWNEEASLLTDHNMLSTVFKDGSGNSAELNLMLLQLLEELEVEAYPVVMSTRSNGIMNPFFPSFEKLNYVIACAYIDGKEHLMDATAEQLPFGLLPERCINGQGRLLSEETTRLIPLNPGGSEESTTFYSLRMDTEGNLSGARRFTGKDFAALDFREQYISHSNKEDFIKQLKSKHPDLSINNLNVENLKNLDQAIKVDYDISLGNQLSSIDTLLFFNPFLLEQIEENPFKLKERKYPVDFAYTKSRNIIISIKLPENLTISEVPESQIISLPENTATAKILYQAANGQLSVNYQFQINKSLFLPEEYSYLKLFYDKIINKQKEPVVLVKKQ
ncbi:hypothetical protein [Marinilabilia sp.]|uniref:hypothetical protein n=1 Tax=Marinilabilia sp. TaxID=2021252 RepID=UPI0025BEE7CB|nr:hypothetical protein [Marinilabilia sp.]